MLILIGLFGYELKNGGQEEDLHVRAACLSCRDWIFLCQEEECQESLGEARVPKI